MLFLKFVPGMFSFFPLWCITMLALALVSDPADSLLVLNPVGCGMFTPPEAHRDHGRAWRPRSAQCHGGSWPQSGYIHAACSLPAWVRTQWWGLGWWVVTCLPTGSFLDILHLVWQACRQTEGLRGKEECWSKDYFKWDLCFNDCFLRSSQKAGCQICRQTCSEEVHRASSVTAHSAVRHSSA